MISKACFTKKRLAGGLIFLALFIFGLFFFRARSLEVRPVSLIFAGQEEGLNELPLSRPDAPAGEYELKLDLYANSGQSRLFHFKSEQIISGIFLNDQPLDLTALQADASAGLKDFYLPISLNRGNNLLKVKLYQQQTQALTFSAAPRPSFLNFLVGFLAFVLFPLILAVKVCFLFLARLRASENRLSALNYPRLILGTGIGLRVFYVLGRVLTPTGQDQDAHLSYVNYWAGHFQLPSVDQGAAFALQPLYYSLAGSLAALLRKLGASESWIWISLIILSGLLSLLFLFYAYRFIKIISQHQLTHSLFLGAIAFTPVFVLPAGRISNEALAALLAIMSAYYIAGYYRRATLRGFFLASATTLLAFSSEFAAGLWIIIWLLVLLYKYFKIKPDQALARRQFLFQQQLILFFGLAALIVVGSTIWRAYVPAVHHFLFATNAPANIAVDAPCNTFLFTGGSQEAVLEHQPWGRLLIQSIHWLGLIYGVGLVIFLFNLTRRSWLLKLFSLAALMNLVAAIHLLDGPPSFCRSGLNYFAPTFGVLALMYAWGLRRLIKLCRQSAWACQLRLAPKLLTWNVLLFLALIAWFGWTFILALS